MAKTDPLHSKSPKPLISKGSFISLGKIDSTNNYAMWTVRSDMAEHGMTWYARNQTSGKGQHGKRWESAPGENIIMTMALEPGDVFQGRLFHFNALVSLCCLQFLQKFTGMEFKLKWPNDIYAGDKKLGGILIENIFRGNKWNWALAGIGINVNQDFSDTENKKATSLFELTNQKFDPETLAKELHEKLLSDMEECDETILSQLAASYNDNLYSKNTMTRFKKENIFFEALVKGVDENGLLILDQNGVERRFQNGELQWVIP